LSTNRDRDQPSGSVAVSFNLLHLVDVGLNLPHPVSSSQEKEQQLGDVEPLSPEFVQGSSRDNGSDLDHLALQLQQSASFEENPNNVWVSAKNACADLWNF